MSNDALARQKPVIVKYVAYQQTGTQPHNTRRHGIGYVAKGRKYIYDGDSRQEVRAGELFYISIGNHYMEDIPENGRPFEQIIFYFEPEQLNKVVSGLSLNYGLDIANDHLCDRCRDAEFLVCREPGILRNFFKLINQYLNDEAFREDPVAEYLKMTELVYLILRRGDDCLKSKLLGSLDSIKDNFDQVIHRNIFKDISIEELAGLCNRSLTSFKKDFKKHFGDSPHKWFIRQRLMYARLQLISTGKSIAEIGNECNFPNTSHFIKLFKKEFGHTPAMYRKLYNRNEMEVADKSLVEA